jgi:hypothetical protein
VDTHIQQADLISLLKKIKGDAQRDKTAKLSHESHKPKILGRHIQTETDGYTGKNVIL